MAVAKWFQIRVNDKVMVWQFYEDESKVEPFGSRGISLSDEEMDELMKLTLADLYNAKTKGVPITDTPTNLLEELAKRAYDEYLKAKEQEEQAKQQVIE